MNCNNHALLYNYDIHLFLILCCIPILHRTFGNTQNVKFQERREWKELEIFRKTVPLKGINCHIDNLIINEWHWFETFIGEESWNYFQITEGKTRKSEIPKIRMYVSSLTSEDHLNPISKTFCWIQCCMYIYEGLKVGFWGQL